MLSRRDKAEVGGLVREDGGLGHGRVDASTRRDRVRPAPTECRVAPLGAELVSTQCLISVGWRKSSARLYWVYVKDGFAAMRARPRRVRIRPKPES